MLSRTFAAIALAASLSGAALAQPNLEPSRVMVKVNGESIVFSQYFQRMQVLPNVGRLINDKFVPSTPGMLTLQQLINERLMVQLAREQGVLPSDAEISAEVERRKRDEPLLFQAFVQLGLPEEEFRWDTLVNLAQFRLITKGVNVVDMEVEARYKANLATRYTLPKRYTLRVITVSRKEDQAKVDEALAAKKPWGEVASEFSQDSGKLDEGRFGVIPDSELAGALRPEIVKLNKGDMTGWITAGNLFAKFWLENVQEKEVIPFDDNLKRDIRRELLVERGQMKNDLSRMMTDMRKKANLEFGGSPFDAQLRQLFQPGSGS